ncbi:MAG: 16S rRNA (guanine(966)-N(2))-methyltransferase RsmD [Thermodesulfovibrionaceae bacterium]
MKTTSVRPTPSVVRKAIFDILQHIEGKSFLDIYAGKGFVGIEALKRGADKVFFVERNPVLCSFIKNTLKKKNLSEKAEVYMKDAVRFLEETDELFDIIFADPPYLTGELERFFRCLEKRDILKEDGVVIIQHHKNEAIKEKLKCLRVHKCYKYGDTLLTVYRRQE